MRISRSAWRLLTFLVLLWPGAALADGDATLSCTAGQPSGGTSLFLACSTSNINQPFSSLMCGVEQNLNTILSAIYCGVQAALIGPLEAAIILYIVFFGIKLSLGYVRQPAAESMMHLMKICMIWIFATDSAWGIGVAYNFFLTAIKQGVGWMLSAVTNQPATDITSAFSIMDNLIDSTITGTAAGNGPALTGFIAALSYLVPPVFFLFAYFFVKSIIILVRALLSYLLGISVIAFLMTMSPIFFSFALFQVTRQFFEDWLKYMISFALQVILIFAGLAMWFIMVGWIGGAFFTTLSNMIIQVYDIATVGSVSVPMNEWAFCQSGQTMTDPTSGVLACAGGDSDTMLLSQVAQDPVVNIQNMGSVPFLLFIVYNIMLLCIVGYCFDTLMKMIPDLARQLAGPAYAPSLGVGYSGVGTIHFPGMSELSSAGTRAGQSFLSSGGSLTNRIGSSLRAGATDDGGEGWGSRFVSKNNDTGIGNRHGVGPAPGGTGGGGGGGSTGT